MSDKLLPCPFCGNEKNIVMANEKHDHSGGYFIACPACDASTGLRYACGEDPRPLLVEQWNRRAAIAQAQSCVPAVIAEVIGCVRAAEVEGLHEALSETTDERLKDLIERRLMHALYACEAAASTQPQQVQPSERWHVGDSAFESWFSDYSPAGKGDKQRARDAYAAGMGELLQVAQAKPERAARPMSIEEIDVALQEHKRIDLGNIDPARGVFILGVVAAERHHGIAAPQPKD